MTRQRVLLHSSASREDAKLAAYNLNWTLKDQREKTRTSPFRITYRAQSSEFIFYTEDAVLSLAFLESEEQRGSDLLPGIRRHLETVEVAEVMAVLSDAISSNAIRLALRQAAILAPRNFEMRWFKIIEPWFNDPRQEIRLTAVLTSAYLGWSEFVPELQRLSQKDADIDVREDARAVLERINELGRIRLVP